MAGKRQKPPDELVYRRGGRATPGAGRSGPARAADS